MIFTSIKKCFDTVSDTVYEISMFIRINLFEFKIPKLKNVQKNDIYMYEIVQI